LFQGIKVLQHLVQKEDDDSEGKDHGDEDAEEPKKSKKRDKKLKKVDHVHETKGQGRALRYLDGWNEMQNGKAGWKFEKCRQIWLLDHAYDKVSMLYNFFPCYWRRWPYK
jgi:WKF domain